MILVSVFHYLWLGTIIIVVITLYIQGRNALAIFPDIKTVRVRFRDRMGSGYSNKNWMTKIGGANRSLDIVVTDKELWLKSVLLLAGIGQRYDLIHKVTLNKVTIAGENENGVNLEFANDAGELKQITVVTKDKEGFLKCLRDSASQSQ